MAAPCPSAEVHFAQKLAANEKRTRDIAFKKLKKWLQSRTSDGKGKLRFNLARKLIIYIEILSTTCITEYFTLIFQSWNSCYTLGFFCIVALFMKNNTLSFESE